MFICCLVTQWSKRAVRKFYGWRKFCQNKLHTTYTPKQLFCPEQRASDVGQVFLHLKHSSARQRGCMLHRPDMYSTKRQDTRVLKHLLESHACSCACSRIKARLNLLQRTKEVPSLSSTSFGTIYSNCSIRFRSILCADSPDIRTKAVTLAGACKRRNFEKHTVQCTRYVGHVCPA